MAPIEPEYKKDSQSLKMDENSYLEWFFNPKPCEEIRIPFRFSVEFPKNTPISGLK